MFYLSLLKMYGMEQLLREIFFEYIKKKNIKIYNLEYNIKIKVSEVKLIKDYLEVIFSIEINDGNNITNDSYTKKIFIEQEFLNTTDFFAAINKLYRSKWLNLVYVLTDGNIENSLCFALDINYIKWVNDYKNISDKLTEIFIEKFDKLYNEKGLSFVKFCEVIDDIKTFNTLSYVEDTEGWIRITAYVKVDDLINTSFDNRIKIKNFKNPNFLKKVLKESYEYCIADSSLTYIKNMLKYSIV